MKKLAIAVMAACLSLGSPALSGSRVFADMDRPVGSSYPLYCESQETPFSDTIDVAEPAPKKKQDSLGEKSLIQKRIIPYSQPIPPGPPPGSVMPFSDSPRNKMQMPLFHNAVVINEYTRKYDAEDGPVYLHEVMMDLNGDGRPDIIVTYRVCDQCGTYVMLPRPFAIYDLRTGKAYMDDDMDGIVNGTPRTEDYYDFAGRNAPRCPRTCI